MRPHRLTRPATLVLALVALVVPTAAAQAQDLRTPDARDTSRDAGTVSPTMPADLRSPDARETSSSAVTVTPVDLRTADARDAAEGRGTFNAPEVAVIEVPKPSPAAAGGMDWGDAGIGAGTLLAVILLGLGSVLAVMHRRHGAPAHRDTATG
jgi:hypothetical protein